MYFEQFIAEKNNAKSTNEVYESSVKAYERCIGQSLDTLIEEADREEEENIRWKNRKIRRHLIDFRKWLYENKSEGTVSRYLGNIKTIYRHFEIELRPLPSFNSKQIDKTYIKTYEDIPTKEELISAYYEATNVTKCVMLLGISSGMSRVDMFNLTVSDFINACADYINTSFNGVIEVLNHLNQVDNIIPYFEGYRQKTDSRFTTFASPEFAEHMIHYLLGRDAKIRKAYDKADEDDKEFLPTCLELEDRLFDVNPRYLSECIREINTKLQFGKVGKFTKLRTHQFRAFQATTLLNKGGFSESEIDALQGRKKDKTHRAYFVESTSKLKEKYYAAVDNLMLFKSVHEVDVEEYERVKEENRKVNEKLEDIIKTQQKLEAMVGIINE